MMMKLWQLNKGDKFSAVFEDAEDSSVKHFIVATMLGIDGMFARIKVQGSDYASYYHVMLDVDLIEKADPYAGV